MNTNSTPAGETVPVSTTDQLQFDQAEFTGTDALGCALCKTPVTESYYQVNGQTVCSACQPKIHAAIASGSKRGRGAKAFGAGLAAAFAGFLVYWGIRVTTGYEFALVAIVVGWMVGRSVRWGSNFRGGWFYQLMAVALTYGSIASTYMPDVLRGMQEGQEEMAAEEMALSAEAGGAEGEAGIAVPGAENSAAMAAEEGAGSEMPLWFEAIFAFIISLAVPFLGGTDNLIGWVIIAVGLWEAWRANKRAPLEVAGPFRIGTQPSGT